MKKFKVTISTNSFKNEQCVIECTHFVVNGEYTIFYNGANPIASFLKLVAVVEQDCKLITDL